MPIFDHNQPKIIKVIIIFPFLTRLITDFTFTYREDGRKLKMDSIIMTSNYSYMVLE